MEDQQDQDDEHIAPGHPDELQLLRDQNRALIKRSQTLTKKSQKLELEVDLLKAERSQRVSILVINLSKSSSLENQVI